MQEKVVINYRQAAAAGEMTAKGGPDQLSPARRTRYLHDNRIRDSLAEYLESLGD